MSTTMTVSPMPGTSVAPADSNTPPGTAVPFYLYAFILIIVLVVLAITLSVWRGVNLRRRRQAMGLPVENLFGSTQQSADPVVEDPPVMYHVYLRPSIAPEPTTDDRLSSSSSDYDEKKAAALAMPGQWHGTRPVSTTLIDTTDDAPLNTNAHSSTSSTGVIDKMKALAWKRKPAPSNDVEAAKPDYDAPPPDYQQVVTSVLIAMPSQNHGRYHLHPGEEPPLPEVSFGVHEGQWTGSASSA